MEIAGNVFLSLVFGGLKKSIENDFLEMPIYCALNGKMKKIMVYFFCWHSSECWKKVNVLLQTFFCLTKDKIKSFPLGNLYGKK